MGRKKGAGVERVRRWPRLSWSCGTVLAVGCASAAPVGTGGTAPVSGVDAAAVCQLLGEHVGLNDVSVPAGAQRVALRLTDARVRVVPAAGGALAALHVEAPLVFDTSYPLHALDVRTTRALSPGLGGITLGRGVRPTVIDVRGDALVVSLAADLGLELEPSPELPCHALALAPEGATRETPVRKQRAEAHLASLAPAGISLHPTARGARAWRLRYTGPVELLGSDGDWFHVRAEWEDGSLLDGWTPTPPAPGAAPWPSVHVDGVSMPGGCHASDEPPTRKLLARAGAAVSAAPDGATWARFAAPTWVEARGSRDDGWLSLATVPGIAVDACEHWFWVRAADVAEATPP